MYFQTISLQTIVSMLITWLNNQLGKEYSAQEQWLIAIVNLMCWILQYGGWTAVKLSAYSLCSVLAQSAEKQHELVIIMLLVKFPELTSVTVSEPNVYGILIRVTVRIYSGSTGAFCVFRQQAPLWAPHRNAHSNERVRSRKHAVQFTTFNCDKSSITIV
jgi:hypothetical protein